MIKINVYDNNMIKVLSETLVPEGGRSEECKSQ